MCEQQLHTYYDADTRIRSCVTTRYISADNYVLTMATTACHIRLRSMFCVLATASAVKQKSIVQQYDVSGYALDSASPLQHKHQDCHVRSCVAHGQYSVLQIRATTSVSDTQTTFHHLVHT